MKISYLAIVTSIFLYGLTTIFMLSEDPKSSQAKAKNVEKSEEAVQTILSVLKHPRCINCHPSNDRPKWGSKGFNHPANIQRGPAGMGMPGLSCTSCHHETNNTYSGVPGAPHWHLAPASMGWEGLSDKQIIQNLLDKKMNGNRSVEEIYKHITEDALVQWAWKPGSKREAPSVSQAELALALLKWIDAGTPLPN
jgi:hypothetical protein